MHRLTYESVLHASNQTVWEFFSDPGNLATITPPDLSFNIQSAPDSMYAGAIIEYTVTPFPGISLRWVSEITHVEPGSFFVDEQRHGPFAFWHHQHHFVDEGPTIRMRDLVHYALPFGVLSEPVRRLFVEPRIRAIFDYRAKVTEERFGPEKGAAAHA